MVNGVGGVEGLVVLGEETPLGDTVHGHGQVGLSGQLRKRVGNRRRELDCVRGWWCGVGWRFFRVAFQNSDERGGGADKRGVRGFSNSGGLEGGS